jgi:hypothetical protein
LSAWARQERSSGVSCRIGWATAVVSLAIDEKTAANRSANNRNNELGLIAGITRALGTNIKKAPLGCRPSGLLLFGGHNLVVRLLRRLALGQDSGRLANRAAQSLITECTVAEILENLKGTISTRAGCLRTEHADADGQFRQYLAGRSGRGMTTILIIVLLVILLGGGGLYGRGRWY